MNGSQALRRLRAWKEGRPLPRGETLHFPIAEDEDLLVVVFLRMGGESSPWGIAWGTPAGDPTILSVPEPRNRDRVAQMATEFAPVLLAHLFHPEHSDIQIYSVDQQRPLRQVWLPNASHVDMLHHLAYTYTFARKGEPGRIPLLNALGRAAGWLFREYNRPGQMTLLAASEALKESFTFPSEDVRQGHLGYLLAWLETDGGRDARLAAAANAEEQSISTTLNPAIERDDLEGLVERHGEAEREGKPTEMKGAANDIAGILGRELTRRFELTARAINWLRHDPRRVNAGANPLLQDGRAPFWFGYMKTERSLVDDPSAPPFVPSPETDRRPATAAGNYFAQQGYEDRQEMLILEDDVEMQAEAFAAGEAIHGRISRVRDEGPDERRPQCGMSSSTASPRRNWEKTRRSSLPACVADRAGSGGSIFATGRPPSKSKSRT